MPYIRRLDISALPYSFTSKGTLPDFPVVYVIFNDSEVFYVRATVSLYRRWSAHRNNPNLRKVTKDRTVKVAWISAPVRQFSDLKLALIQFLNPKLNKYRKGKTCHYQELSYSRKRATHHRLESRSNGNSK